MIKRQTLRAFRHRRRHYRPLSKKGRSLFLKTLCHDACEMEITSLLKEKKNIPQLSKEIMAKTTISETELWKTMTTKKRKGIIPYLFQSIIVQYYDEITEKLIFEHQHKRSTNKNTHLQLKKHRHRLNRLSELKLKATIPRVLSKDFSPDFHSAMDPLIKNELNKQ